MKAIKKKLLIRVMHYCSKQLCKLNTQDNTNGGSITKKYCSTHIVAINK